MTCDRFFQGGADKRRFRTPFLRSARHTRPSSRRLAALALGVLVSLTAPLFASEAEPEAGKISDYYEIENIQPPEGVVPEIGGITFMPDGRLAVAFHRDGVWTYQPESGEWKQFAEGLMTPLGLHAESDTSIVVAQRPELTRLRDTDGDGDADLFETITDDFGMSGNYHEFVFGPAVGPDGNYYIGLNTASEHAGVHQETRGERNPRSRAGRMYSYVPYRGWILRVTPEGEVTPWALGFRSPDGIGFDDEGNLFATDNQGDWIGTSPLYHVERGKFYGHAASLAWKEDFEGIPLEKPVATLAKMRTRGAVLFPHGTMASSPTQPVSDSTGGAFGPFAGQLFVGEMNQPRIMRVMTEEVAGVIQGAAAPFYDASGLALGVHRMAFGPDGSLWVGHTMREHAWAGGTGLQRITWSGEKPMDVLRMNLTEEGFDLTFTRPVDPTTASDPDAYEFTRYYYEYHERYGSEKFNQTPIEVTAAHVGRDGRSVSLELADLKPGRIYELHLRGLKSADGAPLVNPFLAYHLRRLLDGTAPPPLMAMDNEPLELENGRGSFEAEDAQTFVGAKVLVQKDGPGSEKCLNFINDKKDYAEWTIAADQAGEYRISFRYSLDAGPRAMRLTVNGDTVEKSLGFTNTGGWTTWETISHQAKLKKGNNVIRLQATGDSGPDVDRIIIHPAARKP